MRFLDSVGSFRCKEKRRLAAYKTEEDEMAPIMEPPEKLRHDPVEPTRKHRNTGGVRRFLAGTLAGLLLAAGVFYLGQRSVGGTVVAAPTIQTNGKTNSVDAAAIYRADAQGTVLIESQLSGGQGLFGFGQDRGTALGSGFVVDGQGRILTNYHVVDGASKITVTLQDEKSYDATLAGSDPSSDLAVLKIDAPSSELRPLPLGDSSKVAVGEPVVAIGNPLGLSGSETQGIVSALGRDIQAPNGFTITGAIQTDAAITNGNSGGPLIDANGRVIGINSQVAANQTGTAQAEGVGFAVPINTAKTVLSQIEKTGSVAHPYLGISGIGITPEIAGLFPTEQGVAVSQVTPGGPADDAGIRGGDRVADVDGQQVVTGGDVIVAVDGKPVSDMSELLAAISKYRVGQTVTLKVVRNSGNAAVSVTLADRPASVQN